LTCNLNKSKYFGKSGNGDLNKQVFDADHVFGFTIVFKNNHINCVKKEFPYLSEYLNKIILPQTNCYYLNYLVITNGKKIKKHIDDTLLSYFESKRTENAKYVSVLYLIISEQMKGGELVLEHHKDKNIKKIKNVVEPKENLMVLFDGNLYHSVNKFGSDKVRASLVCEQYELEPSELNTIKGFTVHNQKTNKKIHFCD